MDLRPAITVLKALEIGLDVKIRGYTYTLCEDDERKYILAIKAFGGDGSVKYLNPDITFNGFLKMCDELSSDEVFLLNADIALNKQKRAG